MFENSEIDILEILKNHHSLRIAYQRMLTNKSVGPIDFNKNSLFAHAQSIIKEQAEVLMQ